MIMRKRFKFTESQNIQELERTHKDHQVQLKWMVHAGIEPMTLQFLVPCSNQPT